MHIYFDLDETIIDDTGDILRPGIIKLLEDLAQDGHRISLWTASTEERGLMVLNQHNLDKHFHITIFRDEYDPDCDGYPKDIRYCNGDLLVDNDPDHIAFTHSIGKQGLLVTSFNTETMKDWADDSMDIYNKVKRVSL